MLRRNSGGRFGDSKVSVRYTLGGLVRYSGLLQALSEPEVRNRVGPGEQFKPEHPVGQARHPPCHRSLAVLQPDSVAGVLHHAEEVCAGAGSGVEYVHPFLGKRKRLAKPGPQQLRREASLRAHDLYRRVVDAPIVPEFRVIRAEKVFVEVYPGVSLSIEARRVHCADSPFEQFYGHAELSADGVGFQEAHRLGEQCMLAPQRLAGERRPQLLRPLEPR